MKQSALPAGVERFGDIHNSPPEPAPLMRKHDRGRYPTRASNVIIEPEA